jgi:hypothetical protein
MSNRNTHNHSKASFASIITAIAFMLLPVFYILSLINGIDPFGCPPGTKTISSPTSIESWCLEE